MIFSLKRSAGILSCLQPFALRLKALRIHLTELIFWHWIIQMTIRCRGLVSLYRQQLGPVDAIIADQYTRKHSD